LSASQIAQVNAEYGPYYKNSLLYLACVHLPDLSPEECVARAHDLGLAALLGDSIYNFGELVSSFLKTLLIQTPAYNAFPLDSCNIPFSLPSTIPSTLGSSPCYMPLTLAISASSRASCLISLPR
jgi:26S proteasome regulatory subunit N9